MQDTQALHILQSTFGYPSFRGEQAAIVQTIANGNDALVLMPTGGGKSLCYQIPALIRPGTAIVVSPLIALMQDQVDTLRELGIQAAYLNSSLTPQEGRIIEQKLVNGNLNLLYVAPERLLMPHFLEQLRQCQLALFAIDEAHCVSQWGHDFRPEYLKLDVLHTQFPGVPRIALTATADATTRADIIKRLHLENAAVFIAGFDRPNIQYRITEKLNPKKQLLAFLKEEHPHDAGIVYCLSRKSVDEVAQWLKQQGFQALPYHAGLSQKVRQHHQSLFLRGEGVVMVATIAFGMGIDKPNVRFVAHMDLPKSMEAYYQETGRAGRDGLPSTAWMTYGIRDVIIQRHMLNTSEAGPEQKRIEQRKLDALLGFCETASCRRDALLRYFGETHSVSCNNCDTCLYPVERFDGTEIARKALSCVYRTRESFGMQHLIDVLTGKSNDKITRFRHDVLSVFGIGKELGANEWRSVFRQLVSLGLLHVDMDAFGAFKLTSLSAAVLKGEQSISLRKQTQKPAKGKTSRSHITSIEPASQTLLSRLKALRLQLAQKLGVPPYVIFHDRTLIDMAQQQPTTLNELGRIHGVGAHKLQKYGDVFLESIQAMEA